jgi:hypothetical protein
VIARVWHGWTTRGNAAAYEDLLRSEILPGIARRGIRGLTGEHLFRREDGEEIEFVTILWFESMEAVREFAGEDYETAVVPEKAQRLLARFDARSQHYETVIEPG